jgi:hypothetical protein
MMAPVLDGMLAVLILLALVLGVRLQRSLRLLRSSDGELERLIVALNGASARSEAALQGLKNAAAAADERLSSAQRLLDDLRFLTSRGEQLAARLEEEVRQGRSRSPTDPPNAAPARPRPPPDNPARTAALERTLSRLR